MRYLALDLGSTWTKTAVIDSERGVICRRSCPTPQPLARVGRHETDADAYFAQVMAALNDLPRQDAQGLLISTQMHGCVLTDEHFRPLTPYISWQDSLGARYLPEIRRHLADEDTAPAGVPLKGNLALCALLARRCAGDRLPERAHFNTLGGYIIGRLTGSHVCHMSNAAPTGLADIRRGAWNEALIEKAGMTGWTFPRLTTGIEAIGRWQGLDVHADLGDQQVCAAGALTAPGKGVHISVGTAGLIGVLTEQWGTGVYENRPWLTGGLYLRTASGLPGGRHMAGLAAFLRQTAAALAGHDVPEEAVWALLTSADRPGEASNGWGLLTHTPADMLPAFYATMAESYREAVRRLDAAPEYTVFSGGAAEKNPALRQAIGRALGCRCVPGDHDVWQGMQAVLKMLQT